MARSNENGIIYEIIRLGAYVKVSAVDPVTSIEVSVIGPAKVEGLEAMKRVARRKLERAIARGGAPEGCC
jgi:hypothetical protein